MSLKAIVLEILPSAAYRVKLENEDVVVVHAASAVARNFVRLRPGDRVAIELSEKDRTRGRIVRVLEKEGT